jgi:hypothetical protein
VRVDGAGRDVGLDAPHVVEQHRARLHAVLAVVQRDQQLELERRELDFDALDPQAMSAAVDAQHAEREPVVRLGARGRRAPQNGLHAQQELAHAERLDHVVFRPELEADDAVDLLALGRHHQHGHVLGARVGLERAANLRPRDVGEHEVEDHQIRLLVGEQAQSVLAAHGAHDVVPGLPQVVSEDLLEILLVLDDQHSSHGALVYLKDGEAASLA